jgi:hypothetical protein
MVSGHGPYFPFFARNLWILYGNNDKSDRQQKRLFGGVLFPGTFRLFAE